VKALPAPSTGHKLHFFADAVVQGSRVPQGFAVRVMASGVKSYLLDYRVGGKQRRVTIGQTGAWSVLQAVTKARELRREIDAGGDPLAIVAAAPAAPAVVTVAEVLDQYLARAGLRRPDNYVSMYDRIVKPEIGGIPVAELKRSRIAQMLDGVEDKCGATSANRCMEYLRAALNWWGNRDDDYVPPRLNGLRRKAAIGGRDRILTDDEICNIWPHLAGTFGAAIKFLFLTGQRRGDVSGMAWSELEGDTWAIPAGRYKTGKQQVVPLSRAAQVILNGQDKSTRLVFPGRRGQPLYLGNLLKAELDEASGVTGWVVHDLRRTARSLMARAGVQRDVAERVLGHSVGGAVERTYDRHSYLDEKREALERLAGQIDRILHPEAKVVPLRHLHKAT